MPANDRRATIGDHLVGLPSYGGFHPAEPWEVQQVVVGYLVLWQEVKAERQEAKAERQEAKAERQVLEAKIDRLREEMVEARVRSEMQAKVEAAETKLRDQRVLESKLREQQLATLQARLETLYTTKLLADDDLYAVEDAIADSEEGAEDDCVPALLVLSSKMASDRAFARQLQRKKWF